jgi:RES domain-containing protein
MQVYRLAKAKHIHDLYGAGARISGGRWNEKGVSAIYAAESRSLATVEYLVHVPIAMKPKHLGMAVIEIPDSAPKAGISIADLPPNWRDYPAPPELAKIGTDWLSAVSELLLYVPSVVVAGERNIIINPAHPDMKHVKIITVEDYEFDRRLFDK